MPTSSARGSCPPARRSSSAPPSLRDRARRRAPPAIASTRLSVQQLTHQSRSSGAERGANRELALARRGAREQQTREIHRRDEQHEPDGAEQHEQARSHLADHRLAAAARPMRPRSSRFSGYSSASPRAMRIQLGVRLRDGDARLHARDDARACAPGGCAESSRRESSRTGCRRRRAATESGMTPASRRRSRTSRRRACTRWPMTERDAAELSLPERARRARRAVVRAAHHLVVARHAAEHRMARRACSRIPARRTWRRDAAARRCR